MPFGLDQFIASGRSRLNPDPYMNFDTARIGGGMLPDEESPEDQARRLMANIGGVLPSQMNQFNGFLAKPRPRPAPADYYGLGAGAIPNRMPDEPSSYREQVGVNGLPINNTAPQPFTRAPMPEMKDWTGIVGPNQAAMRQQSKGVPAADALSQFVGPREFVGPTVPEYTDSMIGGEMGPPAPLARNTYGGDYNPNMSAYDNGMPANPFYMGSRPDPVHTLGISGGFRSGGSRATVDDSAGHAFDMAGRQNLAMQEILGRNEATRANNQNDLMRTMLGVNQRGDAARANSENRFLSILGKVPEGKATPYIKEGMAAGHLDKTIGHDMLLNDMLTRAKQSAKTGSGVDLRKFLGTLSSEFNPNELSRAELINKIQQMGYTADQIDAYKDDPQVGPFAKSLLGPREYYETHGMGAITADASDRMKQLWSLISGR